ncbi:MAG: PAS domain-containing protein, partial [Candidatus Omnitrophica bacterium]|nr:PAS domain-containing protein [Candidatus Omnitrophota bacterium]
PSCKRFLDYSPEEVQHRNVFDFIHTGDLLNVLQRFSELTQNQSCKEVIEFRIRHKDGGWRVLEATAINLLADPDINGIIVNSRDVSDRKNLDEQILKASESECSRIAQELHDGLNQDLAAIEFMSKSLERKLEKSSAPELADAQNITRQLNYAIQKTRRLSKGIYPLGISSVGLVSSLAALVEDTKNQHNVDCVMNCDDMAIPSDEIATHVYHIVREAFKNAIRHGSATQIIVSAVRSNGKYIVEISDNGSGLKVKNEVREGIGLQIMRHRSRIINGSLGIHPQINGTGTRIVCSFPVSLPEDGKDD